MVKLKVTVHPNADIEQCRKQELPSVICASDIDLLKIIRVNNIL